MQWAIGAIALAAGVLLFARPRGDAEALPPYVLEASGAATARGPETAPRGCVLHVGAGEFELVAKAERPVGTAIEAHVFLQQGVTTVPWSGPTATISEQGSVRLSASAQTLEGAGELRLVVGRGLDSAEALELARAGTERAHARLLRCAIEP